MFKYNKCIECCKRAVKYCCLRDTFGAIFLSGCLNENYDTNGHNELSQISDICQKICSYVDYNKSIKDQRKYEVVPVYKYTKNQYMECQIIV